MRRLSHSAEARPTDVVISVLLAASLIDAFEDIDEKLSSAVAATFEGVKDVHSDGCRGLIWSMSFAVRVQMMLQQHKLPLAEAMGRCIDCTLAAGANGRPFKPWSTQPLQAQSSCSLRRDPSSLGDRHQSRRQFGAARACWNALVLYFLKLQTPPKTETVAASCGQITVVLSRTLCRCIRSNHPSSSCLEALFHIT